MAGALATRMKILFISRAMANLITISRILLVLPFCAAFLANAPWNATVATALFGLAALSDFLDGRIARARGETSALGAALDPLADKLLVAAALFLLTRNGVISGAHVWAALLILLREILVGGLREALAARPEAEGGGALPVAGLAKMKTAVQMIAVVLLLLGAPNGLASIDAVRNAGLAALWLAAALTAYTGARYGAEAVSRLRGAGGRNLGRTA